MLHVKMPTKATVAESFQLLAACNQAERETEPVELDCVATEFFGPFGVALLASCMSVRRHHGRTTTFRLPSARETREFIREVGLARFATGDHVNAGTVEVREMRALDSVYTQAVTEIIARGVPGITEDESYPIQLCLNELLQNVFEWANSPIGCTVLARWYHRSRTVRLAVVDRGIGIPAALRRKRIRGLHRSDDAEVIVAAVTQPKLTSRDNRVGGLGLKTIREIVCGRGGALTVISLNAKVAWKGEKVSQRRTKHPLRGTAVVIEFSPDAPFKEPDEYVSVF